MSIVAQTTSLATEYRRYGDVWMKWLVPMTLTIWKRPP
jgi:hypothetical protein